MEKDAILEFYPEILLHVLQKSIHFNNHHKIPTMVIPSHYSLRMYTTARFYKRKFNYYTPKKNKDKEFKRVILVKKFTGLKRFRRGIKQKIRRLPSLVLDNFFLYQTIIVSKKELDNIFKEILETEK